MKTVKNSAGWCSGIFQFDFSPLSNSHFTLLRENPNVVLTAENGHGVHFGGGPGTAKLVVLTKAKRCAARMELGP
jgi:hypothetical protein